ncbi:MAG: VOC family protein [Acidimicrobiales bacterium]|jgi:PhnB protein
MSRVEPVPEHLHTVTPRLVVRNAADAIAFYASAFAAEEIGERITGPGGELIHAELRIGDSVVFITEDTGDPDALAKAPPLLGGAVSAIMVTYWPSVDSVWDRAVRAGAEVIYPLADQSYGERGGRLRDLYGQQWMLSQRIDKVPQDEVTG